MTVARTVWFFLFRLPQISCFTLSLKCFSSDSDNCPDMEIGPLLQVPHPLRAVPVLLTLLVFPQFLHSTKICVVLCILLLWSGTPECSQLVFCMHFCVWRCTPDLSVERDVLHIHLLFHHLVLSFSLLICHNGHIYQGSSSSESQLRHLGPSWL